MKSRIVWSVVGGLVLVGLAVVIGSSYAQRPGVGFSPFGAPAGRFAVAHASADAVLVLDTATGQVYKAGRDDFKKMSELPRIDERGRPPVIDRDRPFGKEREKKDVDRPRKEREKRDREREGDEKRERKEREGDERKERERREREGREQEERERERNERDRE